MFVILIVIGGLGIPAISSSTGWATGALLLVLTFVYDITVGPVCYSLVAELPSTRLRIKTVVLSRNVYNGKFCKWCLASDFMTDIHNVVCGIIAGSLQPRFMNPTAWNWQGKTAFFWAGANLLGLIWVRNCFSAGTKLSTNLRRRLTSAFLNRKALRMPILTFFSKTRYQRVSSAKSRLILIAPITWWSSPRRTCLRISKRFSEDHSRVAVGSCRWNTLRWNGHHSHLGNETLRSFANGA